MNPRAWRRVSLRPRERVAEREDYVLGRVGRRGRRGRAAPAHVLIDGDDALSRLVDVGGGPLDLLPGLGGDLGISKEHGRLPEAPLGVDAHGREHAGRQELRGRVLRGRERRLGQGAGQRVEAQGVARVRRRRGPRGADDARRPQVGV